MESTEDEHLQKEQPTDSPWGRLGLDYPAHGVVTTLDSTSWEDAMITGNGTIGLLIPGGAERETLTVCHERLFLPVSEPRETIPFAEHVDEFRRLIENGQADMASNLMGELNPLKELNWTDPFVPGFQLHIDLAESISVEESVRMTDYQTAVVTTCFRDQNGQRYQRDAFVSRKDGVAVVRMHSERPFDVIVSLSQVPAPLEGLGAVHAEAITFETPVCKSDQITCKALCKNQWQGRPSGVTAAVRVISNGDQAAGEYGINLLKTTTVTILMSMSVPFVPDLPDCQPDLKTVTELAGDFNELLDRHVAVHKPLFDRVSFSLGTEHIPIETDQLLPAVGDEPLSLRLIEQAFDASRYAIICSTGELPPNLQGVWTGTWASPWSGDYTMNGNVNTAVGFGLNGNYPEVMQALFRFLEQFMNDYRTNARSIFGCSGILLPGRASNAGYSNHLNKQYPHNFWMAGTAWFAQFYFDYWQYTQDETFLAERAIPFMLEAADFYEGVVYRVGGKPRFCPSYSPENTPANQEFPLSYNATMDIAAFKELLRNLISLEGRNGIPDDRVTTWKQLLADAPEYQVDETGAFKEWLSDDIQENQKHRHASQLYPLFHEADPDILSNPDLQDACRNTIEQRLVDRRQHNGGIMAFGLYQLALASANLKDNTRAAECIDWMAQSYWSPAFTCYHNPGKIFNTDICGGLPGAVIQTLVQSSLDEIWLLPALPQTWHSGSISGVCARGGIQLSIEWKGGKLCGVTLCSNTTRSSVVEYDGKKITLNFMKGKSVALNGSLEEIETR